jgi:hypothetical protein
MNVHKVRKDCKYNEAELFSILPFKADFISSSTHDRMFILKNKILPSMFNYWLEIGKEYDSRHSKILSKVVHFQKFAIRFIYYIQQCRNSRSGVQITGVWHMVEEKQFRDFRRGG